MNWDDDREFALLDELVPLPWVDFIYLFGSTARGDARPDSDVDLAVKIGPGAPPSPLFELLKAGNRAAGTGVLHLVIFDHAPAVLRHRIFEEGRLLIERNPVTRMAAQVQAMREVYDLDPVERAEAEHWAALHVDPQGATRRLAVVMEYRKELGLFAQMSLEDFVAARARHHHAERLLHLLTEGMVDLMLHVVVSNQWRSPASALDVLNVLREQSAMDFSLADRLQDWMALRVNLLRRYVDLDHQGSYKHLQRLFEVDEFCQWAGQMVLTPG